LNVIHVADKLQGRHFVRFLVCFTEFNVIVLQATKMSLFYNKQKIWHQTLRTTRQSSLSTVVSPG